MIQDLVPRIGITPYTTNSFTPALTEGWTYAVGEDIGGVVVGCPVDEEHGVKVDNAAGITLR